MKRLKYCLLVILWPVMNGLAQPLPQTIVPLSVGNILPDVVLGKVYNYPTTSVALSQLKDKYIILDFWSSWCGSCIESFPEMHDLQKQFAGQLKILMVNSYANDNKNKVDQFFSFRKQRTGNSFELTYVLEDSILSSYFPHQSIPHYIWLDKNRRVAAITGQEEVTATNIQEWLSGKTLALHVKNDNLLFDESKTELIKNDAADFLYRSLITNYKEDLGCVIGKKTAGNELVSHYYIINYSLLALYQIAFPEIFTVPFNRIIIDRKVYNAFFMNTGKEKKSYCYDLVTRPVTNGEITRMMQADLVRYFNVVACNENKPMDCYVLSSNSDVRKSITKGGVAATDTDERSLKKYIRNSPVSELMSAMSIRLDKPWIDETGLQQNIDISFPYDFFHYNLQQLKEFLLGYGLVLTEAFRTIRVAVLKENPEILN